MLIYNKGKLASKNRACYFTKPATWLFYDMKGEFTKKMY